MEIGHIFKINDRDANIAWWSIIGDIKPTKCTDWLYTVITQIVLFQ
jgi:hypothetical protein